MASSAGQRMSREDYKKSKELEELRKTGSAPPAVDEEGKMINPHMPQYIAQAPWYLNQSKPSMKHQYRAHWKTTDSAKVAKIYDWYARGQKRKTTDDGGELGEAEMSTTADKLNLRKRIKAGACTNCGATTHKTKDCTERPRVRGALKTGENIQPDEVIQHLEFDFEGKRDRWRGYNPASHATTIALWEKTEAARKQQKREELDKELTEPVADDEELKKKRRELRKAKRKEERKKRKEEERKVRREARDKRKQEDDKLKQRMKVLKEDGEADPNETLKPLDTPAQAQQAAATGTAANTNNTDGTNDTDNTSSSSSSSSSTAADGDGKGKAKLGAEPKKEADSDESSEPSDTEGSDSDSDTESESEDEDMKDVGQVIQKRDVKSRTTVRNLRIREDVAKYLRNLNPSSAHYDPKTRSMRENPYPNKDPRELLYAGDNFVRWSGDAQKVQQLTRFVWDANAKGVEEVNVLSNPSQAEKLFDSFKSKKELLKTQRKADVLSKYVSPEAAAKLTAAESADASGAIPHGSGLEADPERELALYQSEHYIEYSEDGKVIKGQEQAVPKSKYVEDVYEQNHKAVWGSYYDRASGKWGYGCCHQIMRQAWCTGEAGKKAKVEMDVEQQKRAQQPFKVPTAPSSSSAAPAAKAGARGQEKLVTKEEALKMSGSSALETALAAERKKLKGADGQGKNKGGYNSDYSATMAPTDEEMEAYRLLRQQSEDPMAKFVNG